MSEAAIERLTHLIPDFLARPWAPWLLTLLNFNPSPDAIRLLTAWCLRLPVQVNAIVRVMTPFTENLKTAAHTPPLTAAVAAFWDAICKHAAVNNAVAPFALQSDTIAALLQSPDSTLRQAGWLLASGTEDDTVASPGKRSPLPI